MLVPGQGDPSLGMLLRCLCVWQGCVSWLWKLSVGQEVQDLGECSSLGKVGHRLFLPCHAQSTHVP